MFDFGSFFAMIILVFGVSSILFCILQNTKASSLKVMLLGLAIMIFAGNVLKDEERANTIVTALGLCIVIAGLMIRGK